MKTYQITGKLKVRPLGSRDEGPFHLGGSVASDGYRDRTILRDSAGRLMIPGTSFCGVLASLARGSLRAAGYGEPERHPAFIALFGSARSGAVFSGQASRLRVSTSRGAISPAGIRDRNAISRSRRSAENQALLHEEVVEGVWSFPVRMEFRESGPRTREECHGGIDPDAAAFRLLLDVLHLLSEGWANVGGNSSIGYGRALLDGCEVSARRRNSAKDVFRFATDADRWGSFPPSPLSGHLSSVPALPAANNPAPSRWSGRVRFRCLLRPVEPLLIRAGYTHEIVTTQGSQRAVEENLSLPWNIIPREFLVDAGFAQDGRGTPCVPGSSVRGSLRSTAERAVRTVTGKNEAAWDLAEARKAGHSFRPTRHFDEDRDVACLVSRVFGFSGLGGRVSFSDAVPQDPGVFAARLKLLDHHASDRFTGAPADRKKFNSCPFFPAHPDHRDASTDLVCEIEIGGYAPWHLGLLLLLLRDLRLGRVRLGSRRHGGKTQLVGLEMGALTVVDDFLAGAAPAGSPTIGGYHTFPPVSLSFNGGGYIEAGSNLLLTARLRQAEQACRDVLASWPHMPAQQPEGGTA